MLKVQGGPAAEKSWSCSGFFSTAGPRFDFAHNLIVNIAMKLVPACG
jgi:hypothetical protein